MGTIRFECCFANKNVKGILRIHERATSFDIDTLRIALRSYLVFFLDGVYSEFGYNCVFIIYVFFFRKNIKLPSRGNTISSGKRTYLCTKEVFVKKSFILTMLQTKYGVSVVSRGIVTFSLIQMVFFAGVLIRKHFLFGTQRSLI